MDPVVNVDLIGQGQGQGEVAKHLLSVNRLDPARLRPWVDINPDGSGSGRTFISVFKGGDKNNPECYESVPLQTNTGTLRRDEWKQLDAAVLRISMERLGGVQDLRDRGLVYPLGNAMGTTVLEYHDISDAMVAELSMDAVTKSLADRPVYGTNYLPIPIIHSDFEINQRVLEASRRMGNPLDTTMVEYAVRKVWEKLEDMLFTNTTYTFGSGTIYSYLNHGSRNAVTLSLAWDNASKTGANILSDVKNMKQASIDDKHYGPWMIYIPTGYETKMEDDYTSSYPKSIRERLMEVQGILGIKVVDHLTADNVIMVQMTSDVVRLVDGMGIQVVEWKSEGGFVSHFKILCIAVPQIRADQAGASGLVHLAA